MTATYSEMEDLYEKCKAESRLDYCDIEEEILVDISRFNMTASQFCRDWEDDNIRELYDGYWVVVDDSRGYGLSGEYLEEETLEECDLEKYKSYRGWGDGITFDASSAELIWSSDDGEVHIFEVL